jgi:hypothetical protein
MWAMPRGLVRNLAVAVGLGLLLASPLLAEEPGAKKAAAGLKSAPTIQELEEMRVEGKIQKPEVFYVLSRTETRYKLPIRSEDFVDRIVRSVEKNPF